VWAQDFPLKSNSRVPVGTCDFEETLVAYFRACGGVDPERLRLYDFTRAVGSLVGCAGPAHLVYAQLTRTPAGNTLIRAQAASVPGVHPVRAGERPRWGHLRLRWLLQTQPASAALPPSGTCGMVLRYDQIEDADKRCY